MSVIDEERVARENVPHVVLAERRGRYFGPNWFASVMGTGIVANAGAVLPVDVAGLKAFCEVVWFLAAILLTTLLVATAIHWMRSPQLARSYGWDTQMSHFYGALPMALLTVGAGALLVAHSILGVRLAVDLDWVLWTAGTVLGLATAAVIPYRMFTAIEVAPDSAFGGWLMPIVPPMVSATTGALLVPHIASPEGRATLLYCCYAMFGVSIVASLIVMTLLWSRFVHYGTSLSRTPTAWIVLGPLGQSVTAVGLLGAVAHLAVPANVAASMTTFAILYGVPVWGFSMLWAVIAASLTVRAIRRKMPFALTWWSFIFPVGVTVTGMIRLATETSPPLFRWASVAGYVVLLGAWLVVAARTLSATSRGQLLSESAPEVQKVLVLKERCPRLFTSSKVA